MPLPSLFPKRSPARSRRRGLPQGRLGAWETLGHGVTGLEPLESRVLMAADVGVQISNAHVFFMQVCVWARVYASGLYVCI